MNKICSVENCDEKYLAKGYCNFHYKREYLWKKICNSNGCKNKQHSGGYCYTHYIKSRGIKCSIENCENPVHSKGICKNHYDINKRKTDPAYAEKSKEKGQRWNKKNPDYWKNWWIDNKERETNRRLPNRDKFLEYMKNYNKLFKKEHDKYAKDAHEKRKIGCLFNYSDGKMECNKCKENNIAFLTIDHIRPRKEYGHDRKTTSSKLYRMLIKDDFPSGYQVLCYNCNMVKEIERRKELKHVENLIAKRNLRYIRKLKIDVMTAYSKGKPHCACCNYDNADGLSIDHMIGRKQQGHSRDLGSMKLYQYLKRENFPKDFQVYCINCNSAKGKFGKCPHQLDKYRKYWK